MTSWLDTKKFMTSLAKTAMAEAQKTLDKALDIDEQEEQNGDSTVILESSVNSGVDQWGSFSGSFFSPIQDKKSSKSSNSQSKCLKRTPKERQEQNNNNFKKIFFFFR